jgi:hypothetical protein
LAGSNRGCRTSDFPAIDASEIAEPEIYGRNRDFRASTAGEFLETTEILEYNSGVSSEFLPPSAFRPAPSESLQSQMTFVLQYILRWQCPAETVQK